MDSAWSTWLVVDKLDKLIILVPNIGDRDVKQK
jgi:hypothetical protein